MGWGGVPPPKGGVLAQKQAKTAKNGQFLLKIGTNLNKILDIHVIEDFIKALQCATLICFCWFFVRNAMEQRPQKATGNSNKKQPISIQNRHKP